jgi:hypothetical protein
VWKRIRRPDTARGPELADLLEEIYVRVEEETETRGEVIHVESCFYTGLDVREAVGQGEGELLGRRAPCLPDVVATYGDGVPLRHVLCGVDEHVLEDAHRGLGREEPFFLGDVLLEDVVLVSALQLLRRDALLLGGDDVHGQQDHRGGVDGHRGRNLTHRDALEETLHVF